MRAKRRVAVLGGAGGIGRALVERLHAQGDSVSVLDLRGSLDRHPAPSEVDELAIDLRDERSIEAAFNTLAGEGALDGFVNLSGFVSAVAPLSAVTTETFDEVISANLRGAFLAARAALPLLRARHGAIVNVASGLAQNVRPGYGPYAMAKAGIIAMTKTLALEAAPDVRVNCVSPGAVDTAFLRGGTGRSDESAEPALDVRSYAQAVPLKRLAVPMDVVGPILFLLSSESRYMTGQNLWVNGGGYMP